MLTEISPPKLSKRSTQTSGLASAQCSWHKTLGQVSKSQQKMLLQQATLYCLGSCHLLRFLTPFLWSFTVGQVPYKTWPGEHQGLAENMKYLQAVLFVAWIFKYIYIYIQLILLGSKQHSTAWVWITKRIWSCLNYILKQAANCCKNNNKKQEKSLIINELQ